MATDKFSQKQSKTTPAGAAARGGELEGGPTWKFQIVEQLYNTVTQAVTTLSKNCFGTISLDVRR